MMYGLLDLDNICLRYSHLKIWNLRVQKKINIEKIAFKIVQMKFLAMHCVLHIIFLIHFSRKFTKYLHGT